MAPSTRALPWILLVAVPVGATLVGFVAMPHPASTAQARAQTDRATLVDVVKSVAPTPNTPADATFGDRIVLRGADLPAGAVSRGSRLPIRFWFEAKGDVDRDWQIFVHLDAKGRDYRINGDHFPANGTYNTTLWRTGDFVADAWSKLVPLDAPSGAYDVWVGFYIGDERLPFTAGDRARHDGSGRVKVGTITLE